MVQVVQVVEVIQVVRVVRMISLDDHQKIIIRKHMVFRLKTIKSKDEMPCP